MLSAYRAWVDEKCRRRVAQRNWEDQWCKRNFLKRKVLQEVSELITELTKRLAGFNIKPSRSLNSR